jgi:hypothetical protein
MFGWMTRRMTGWMTRWTDGWKASFRPQRRLLYKNISVNPVPNAQVK